MSLSIVKTLQKNCMNDHNLVLNFNKQEIGITLLLQFYKKWRVVKYIIRHSASNNRRPVPGDRLLEWLEYHLQLFMGFAEFVFNTSIPNE